MKFEDMDPKIIEKAKACATPEEVVDMLHKEGVELDDGQLEQISGGGWFGHQCPKCGSYDVDSFSNGRMKCSACGFEG